MDDQHITSAIAYGPSNEHDLEDLSSPDPSVRSVVLKRLADALKDADPDVMAQRKAQAVAAATSCLADPFIDVIVSAVRLLQKLESPGRAALLLPLLAVDHRDESDNEDSSVNQAVVEALLDDSETLPFLVRALDRGMLHATRVWETFLENGDKTLVAASYGAALLPFILQEAERGDVEASKILRREAMTQALESSDDTVHKTAQRVLDSTQKVLDAESEQEIREFEERTAQDAQAHREAEVDRLEAERLNAEDLAPNLREFRERFLAKADFNSVRLGIIRSEGWLGPEELNWLGWSLADPKLALNPIMLRAIQAGADPYSKWLNEIGFEGDFPQPPAPRPDALLPPSAEKVFKSSMGMNRMALWLLAPEKWSSLTPRQRTAWAEGMDPLEWTALVDPEFAAEIVAPSCHVLPKPTGRLLLRREYEIGTEYRRQDGSVYKIVARRPNSTLWYILYCDFMQRNGKVSQNVKLLSTDLSSLAQLVPVESGTFDTMVREYQAQKTSAEKVATLKVRHGTAPRFLARPETATVHQFAELSGITAGELQNILRERHGKLLGKRERIAPDLLESLSDDLNIILIPIE